MVKIKMVQLKTDNIKIISHSIGRIGIVKSCFQNLEILRKYKSQSQYSAYLVI